MTKLVFLVYARGRDSADRRQFIVEADSHRDAWKIARAVTRTGRGALLRDPHSQELHPWPLEPGAWTVTRVLTLSSQRRGRPPKLTSEDLQDLAAKHRVTIPPRVRRVIEALQS